MEKYRKIFVTSQCFMSTWCQSRDWLWQDEQKNWLANCKNLMTLAWWKAKQGIAMTVSMANRDETNRLTLFALFSRLAKAFAKAVQWTLRHGRSAGHQVPSRSFISKTSFYMVTHPTMIAVYGCGPLWMYTAYVQGVITVTVGGVHWQDWAHKTNFILIDLSTGQAWTGKGCQGEGRSNSINPHLLETEDLGEALEGCIVVAWLQHIFSHLISSTFGKPLVNHVVNHGKPSSSWLCGN